MWVLIWLAFIAWLGMTKQGRAWGTKTWAWWNPYNFNVGIYDGWEKRKLIAIGKANQEGARRHAEAVERVKEREEQRKPVRAGDILRSPALGGFHTGTSEVYCEITGGVMEGPDHLATRRSGQKLRVEQMIEVLDEKQRQHLEAAETLQVILDENRK